MDFHSGRSTANATTIFVRIQEDTVDLRSKSAREGHPEMEEGDPEARLLDLRKAYPRVSKPALRGILKRSLLRHDSGLTRAFRVQSWGKRGEILNLVSQREA